MKFTFDAYRRLIDMVISKGYTFSKYSNYTNYQKPCILRHDVDFDLQVAEQFAAVEKNMGGGECKQHIFCFNFLEFL